MSVPKPILELARSLPIPNNDYVGVSGCQPGLPFQVLLFCRKPRTRISPDFHYRYIWCYALCGAGQIVLDGKPYSLQAGQRILVKPFVRHQYAPANARDTLECVFIGFEIDSVSAVEQLHGVVQECETHDWVSLYVLLIKYLKHGAKRIDGDFELEQLSSEVALNVSRAIEFGVLSIDRPSPLERTQRITAPQRLVEEVWLFARNASPGPEGDGNGKWILPAGSSASGTTRRTLARHLGVSESTLRDAIQTFAHTSPKEFVRRIRLQRASIWLMEYGFAVQEVARNAGYAEAAAFSNEFKKLMGVRPSSLLKTYEY